MMNNEKKTDDPRKIWNFKRKQIEILPIRLNNNPFRKKFSLWEVCVVYNGGSLCGYSEENIDDRYNLPA